MGAVHARHLWNVGVRKQMELTGAVLVREFQCSQRGKWDNGGKKSQLNFASGNRLDAN